MAGISLSAYLLTEMEEIEERPTLAELRQRVHRRKAVVVETTLPAWYEKNVDCCDYPGCVRRRLIRAHYSRLESALSRTFHTKSTSGPSSAT
jgi:hypothetical protein